MEFTHRFSTRPIPIQILLEEYYTPSKLKKIEKQSRKMGMKHYTLLDKFDPEELLKKFNYLYLIGREYEVPRLDRQKTVGVRDIGNYSNKVNSKMLRESFDDLIRFEDDHPGMLSLMPGDDIFCRGERDDGSEVIRFSMKGLGIDTDTLAKFELGLLTKWPEDGHLPVKMNCLMGILSDKRIPIEELEAYFPDAHKSYINFITASTDQIDQKAKRQVSWLDKQAQQRRELEDIAKSPETWDGYKSSDMVSSSVMREKPWLDIEVEEHNPTESNAGLPLEHLGLEMPHPSLPNEHLGYEPEERELPTERLGSETFESGLPNEHIHRTRITDFFDENESEEPVEDEEDDSKYKWLGYKASLDEVEENFYNRPIPKFNVPEEEEAPQAAATPQPEPGEELLEDIDINEFKDMLVDRIIEENKKADKDHKIVLPDAGSIDNVLGAALSIAKEVSKSLEKN